MATLFEISEDLMALHRLLEDATDESGEINPEAAAALEEWFATVEQDRDNKLDRYAHLCRNLKLQAACRKAEADQIEAEVRRLKLAAQARENQEKRLRERLMMFFDLHSVNRIETQRHKFNVQNNGGVQAVEVSVPAEELPAAFQKVTISPATETLRAALLNGETIKGCTLKERGRSLRIT